MARLFVTAIVLACIAHVEAWCEPYHAELDPDRSGGIVGTIVNAPGELQWVLAVEPFELKAYGATLDADTGRFELRGLPPGEYDLFIKSVGHVHEGLTLQTDPFADPGPDELATMLEGFARTLYPSERYFDTKHIVRLTGDGDTARALVTFIRTRPTRLDSSGSGPMFDGRIRRFALVEMQRTRDVWQIDTLRHLLRQEVASDSGDVELTYAHSTDLAGVLVGERLHDMGEIDLDELEPTPDGRYASERYQEE